MRISDWLDENFCYDPWEPEGNPTLKDIREKEGGLHVIGTCGECEYWKCTKGSTFELHKTKQKLKVGTCKNADVSYKVSSFQARCATEYTENFGCIHYKPLANSEEEKEVWRGID